MSKKIKINNVIKSLNDFQDDILGSKDFSIKSNSNSTSCKCENTFAIICEHFLPLWIFISCNYYLLPNANDKLSNHKVKEIEIFLGSLFKLFDKEFSDKNSEAQKMNQKFKNNITRAEFFDQNNVICDDTSREHIHAFNVKHSKKIPTENILIKLINGEIHLRMGIKFDENKDFCIINIVDKKSKN